ncbi:MAG: hypothetical protein WCS79_10720, partial [Paludibacter sp.]
MPLDIRLMAFDYKKMNKKNLLLVLVVFVSVLSGLFLGNMLSVRHIASGFSGAFSRSGAHSKIDELLSIIKAQYVDSVNTDVMTEEMMTDMVSKLDPHSVYIPASD